MSFFFFFLHTPEVEGRNPVHSSLTNVCLNLFITDLVCLQT